MEFDDIAVSSSGTCSLNFFVHIYNIGQKLSIGTMPNIQKYYITYINLITLNTLPNYEKTLL